VRDAYQRKIMIAVDAKLRKKHGFFYWIFYRFWI